MLNTLPIYLSMPSAQIAVVAPGAISLCWLARACWRRDTPSSLVWAWMGSVIASYFASRWVNDDGYLQLFINPAYLMYTAGRLHCRQPITAGAAFSLTFLSCWVVDMVRAYELVGAGYTGPSTFFLGVGGAGAGDGLYFFPMVSAVLVVYSANRSRLLAAVRGLPLFQRRDFALSVEQVK